MTITALQALVACSAFGPAAARSLWSSKPATHAYRASDDYLLKTAYPVGNGKLGAIPHGPPGLEKAVLSIDSLWSGGPFQSSDYNGGNPESEIHSALPEIRARIFDNGTGSVEPLLGTGEAYGAYQTLGNLTVSIDGVGEYTGYKRSLDLKTGIHTTTYSVDGAELTTSVFCSYPDDVCVYHVSATNTTLLPELTLGFENTLVEKELLDVTCGDDHVRLRGVTQAGPPEGLKYDSIARVTRDSRAATRCSGDGNSLSISTRKGQRAVTIVVGAGTNFDQSKGNAEHDYSFKGADPAAHVKKVTSAAASKKYEHLLRAHLRDYQALESAFSLNLPDPNGSAEKQTADLISAYTADRSTGDPFVEALLFDYSRHLLISSSRPGSLPANLQGRWTEELNPAWSGDYHANINLQMSYWAADQTGLGLTQDALWDYMELNWVPRGSETARLLYDADGWVVHNEMNIFGFTAMKEGASWANYPAAPAWMMQHVWDNFEYTQDSAWFRHQGYPLIKGVAEFWLSQLQEDAFSGDGSLVVNPCNSPEHGPTTFGCAHYQQEIHRTFDTILAGAPYAREKDEDFLDRVSAALEKLDKGFGVTKWGGVKEWKLPESHGYDVKSDHRHLSHLTGWYPGYSLSSYLDGYSTNTTIQSAVRATLVSRGPGNAADGNPGWAKVWRAAAWARLNETERAHWHLRYAVEQNFAGNGLSMYSGRDEPFQIDANFGFAGAVLSMLVVDLQLPHNALAGRKGGHARRTVVLGPAIPEAWGVGSVGGLRIRGGGVVDFSWDDGGIVTDARVKGSRTKVRIVNVKGDILAES